MKHPHPLRNLQNRLKSFWQGSLTALLTLLAISICSGCSFVKMPLNLSNPPTDVTLAIEQIEPSGRPGVYNLVGSTNLPDNTEVTISAIRYLLPEAVPVVDTNLPYAILARQTAEVNAGRWQARLNLWQVAPDGRYQEAWQRAGLQSGTEASASVTFMATLEPLDQVANLEQQLDAENKRLAGNQVRYTPEGEAYLQTSQSLNLPLPTERTTPPPVRVEDINGGWGDRYRLPPTPGGTGSVTVAPTRVDPTDAPLSTDEVLR